METSIQFNVSVKIILENWAINVILLEGLHKTGEHLRNGVFSPKEEMASSKWNGLEDGSTRIEVKILHVLRTVCFNDQLFNIFKFILLIRHVFHSLDIVSNGFGVSSNLFHSL